MCDISSWKMVGVKHRKPFRHSVIPSEVRCFRDILGGPNIFSRDIFWDGCQLGDVDFGKVSTGVDGSVGSCVRCLGYVFVGDFLPMNYPMRFSTRKKHHLGEERARI